MKKIPYGIANFEAVQEHGTYYYVDKTKYIETIEQTGSKFLFFLRPRRFGKSLFISMLEHYYDINRKSQFAELFGTTFIGAQPTPLRNRFPVFKLNFSGIPTDKSTEVIEKSFNMHIKGAINYFYVYYQEFTGGEDQFAADYTALENATDLLNEFIRAMQTRSEDNPTPSDLTHLSCATIASIN